MEFRIKGTGRDTLVAQKKEGGDYGSLLKPDDRPDEVNAPLHKVNGVRPGIDFPASLSPY